VLGGSKLITYAMGVGLRRARRIEVDHVVDARDVEAARRDVRRHQDVVATLPEAAHGAVALGLGHVAL
jgi:flagella basal body P-ring formation protein FlgA